MPTMEERLRLVVEATTGSAEASFGKLTTTAERSATASNSAGDAVRSAADAVVQARAREADATGKLSVAQARLDELRDKGNASASQLVAAEERVAAAQRRVQIASNDTTRALAEQDVVQEDVAASAGQAEGGTDRFGEGVGRLRNQVAGLVAGVSLADWVSESVTGFLDGARGASALAIGMNATVQEGGRFLAVAQQLGLEMGDLVEIQASFAQVVGADDEALSSFGAQLKLNADGTTNWALTLQDALANLQQIPDATKRNETGFRLFGEEGYKQMNALLVSGRDVDEVFASMGTPFDEDDVETTRRYDAAMVELTSTGGSLSRTLGSVLVPILTEVLGGFDTVVDVIGQIPGPIAVAIALTVAYAAANAAAAGSGGLLVAAQGALVGGWGRVTGAVSAATVGTGAFAVTAGVARVAGAGLLATLGGPVGLAILGLGAGFTILNSVMGDNENRAEGVAKATETLTGALEESNGVITRNVREQAALAAQEAGVLDVAERAGVSRGDVTAALLGNEAALKRVKTALAEYAEANRTVIISDESGYTENALNEEGRAAQGAAKSFDELLGSTKDTAEGQGQLAAELGETTDKAALAEAAMDALTAIIDAGTTGGTRLRDAVRGVVEAQDAEAASSDRAEAAIDAYRATTSGAVDAHLALYDAVFSSADAGYAFLDALDTANKATDDASTSVDEVAQAHTKLMQAALGAGEAAGDAAVAAKTAAGEVLTDIDEANVRATAMIDTLRLKLDTPGLTDTAREAIGNLITELETAQGKGDIAAVLSLTGAPEVAGEIDETTEDRTAEVTVESRNGPAVIRYLEGITNASRLALVRVESRGGPAVKTYLDSLAHERLAIIRVETRGGPAVDRYLDGLARDREITFSTRGAGAMRGAPSLAAAGVGSPSVMLGSVTLDLELTGRADRGQLQKAERGRAHIEDIRAYEARNGTGWRRSR